MTGPGPTDNLTKFPKGLISALGLRDFGSAPHTLANSLIGTIESLQLYLLNDREQISANAIAAPVVGSNVCSIAVPPSELWYVWNFAAACDPGAGAAIDMCVATGYDVSNQFFPISPYGAAAATQAVRVASIAPFWAGPGGVFGVHVRSVTLAPAINCNAFITRLRT